MLLDAMLLLAGTTAVSPEIHSETFPPSYPAPQPAPAPAPTPPALPADGYSMYHPVVRIIAVMMTDSRVTHLSVMAATYIFQNHKERLQAHWSRKWQELLISVDLEVRRSFQDVGITLFPLVCFSLLLASQRDTAVYLCTAGVEGWFQLKIYTPEYIFSWHR